MAPASNINKLLKEHTLDLRAEVISAELIEKGVQMENILLTPVNSFQRGYRKDVVKVDVSDEEGKQQVFLEVTREGLYDMLPKGVFHQPMGRDPFKSPEEMLKEIEVQQNEEKHARDFFSVFEAEFYRHKVLIELEERKFFLSSIDGYNQKLFEELWGNVPYLSLFQQTLLLHLLPFAHEIAGNLDLTARCFELLLGEKIKIKLKGSQAYKIPEELLPVLGEVTLGLSFALGKETDDGISSTHVIVGPIKKFSLPEYIYEGKNIEKQIKLLCSYFLPVEAQVQTTILVPKEDTELVFSQKAQENYLGYSTCI